MATRLSFGSRYPQSPDGLRCVRVVDGMHVALEEAMRIGFRRHRPPGKRMVVERFILEERGENIEAQAVRTFLEAVAHDVQHRRLHCRIAVVEVGLKMQEAGEIPLICLRIMVPAAATEHRSPLVRRRLASGLRRTAGRFGRRLCVSTRAGADPCESPQVPAQVLTRDKRGRFDVPTLPRRHCPRASRPATVRHRPPAQSA